MMRSRILTFINKIKYKRKYQKNRMRNKIKKTMKEIIKLMTLTKKLKLIWREWTKPMRKTWKEIKNKMVLTT